MRRTGILATVGLLVLASGCGSGKTHTAASHPPTTTTVGQPATPVALEEAARKALDANGRLSAYVLWSNQVPSWASQSTRGPALAGLMASAAGRRKQDVRVRSLSGKVQVLTVQLDPSYASATATIHTSERVALYRHGRHERTLTLDERDRVVLHRLGQAMRFIVWEVQPQK